MLIDKIDKTLSNKLKFLPHGLVYRYEIISPGNEEYYFIPIELDR